MSHQADRDQFVATMTAEGMSLEIIRRILRHAQTIQRCAELECSSEAADRDRVPCPATLPRPGKCLCDYSVGGGGRDANGERIHETIPRVTLTSARAEAAITKWCAKVNVSPICPTCGKVGELLIGDPYKNKPLYQGKGDKTRRYGDWYHRWSWHGFEPVFSGDPRGYCVKIKVPSGQSNTWGQDGIGVPARGLPASAFR